MTREGGETGMRALKNACRDATAKNGDGLKSRVFRGHPWKQSGRASRKGNGRCLFMHRRKKAVGGGQAIRATGRRRAAKRGGSSFVSMESLQQHAKKGKEAAN